MGLEQEQNKSRPAIPVSKSARRAKALTSRLDKKKIRLSRGTARTSALTIRGVEQACKAAKSSKGNTFVNASIAHRVIQR